MQKETILQEAKCEKNGRQAEKSRGSYMIIIIGCENSDTPQSESSSRQGKRQDESPQERQKTFNSIGESHT